MKCLYTAIVLATLLLCGILLYRNVSYECRDYGYSTYRVLRCGPRDVSVECWRSGLVTWRYEHHAYTWVPSNNLEPIELTD